MTLFAAALREQQRAAQVVDDMADRLEANAGPLLGWSVIQAKIRILRCAAAAIRDQDAPPSPVSRSGIPITRRKA